MGELTLINADVRKWEWGGRPFHAMLCDPPYEIDFMGNGWDSSGVAFEPATWGRLLAALHPGAFAISFAGSQMQSWAGIANAIMRAGFAPHPSLHLLSWVQSQGWPKGVNVSKAIDAEAGAEREVVGHAKGQGRTKNDRGEWGLKPNTAPSTPLAKTWDGYRYGVQALRPCAEPALVFQRPYEGRPLDCITATGAGALNIEAGRIGHNDPEKRTERRAGRGRTFGFHNDWEGIASANPAGRFPSNVMIIHLPECRRVGTKKVKGSSREDRPAKCGGAVGLGTVSSGFHAHQSPGYADADGLEEVEEWECAPGCPAALLGAQSGKSKAQPRAGDGGSVSVDGSWGFKRMPHNISDEGDASRFYHNAGWEHEVAEQMAGAVPWQYESKASTTEREAGLVGTFPCVRCGDKNSITHIERNEQTGGEYEVVCRRNQHVTVKPIGLTRHLAALLLPPQEYAPRRILIPFAGVGSEAIGALLAGWDEIVCIEQDPDYCDILKARFDWWRMNPTGAVARAAAKHSRAAGCAVGDPLDW